MYKYSKFLNILSVFIRKEVTQYTIDKLFVFLNKR